MSRFIATSAIKWGICSAETEEAVIASMSRLNAGAARAGREAEVSTATDVTGFGLLGHLLEERIDVDQLVRRRAWNAGASGRNAIRVPHDIIVDDRGA